MKVISALFLLLIVASVLAVVYLPWWGSAVVIVLFIVGAKFFGGRMVEALFKMPFKAKGAVLRGATAEIHSITPIVRPAAGDAEDKNDTNRRFYLLEVTITPAAHESGSFQLWEPGELQLVGQDARPDDAGDDDLCTIRQMEIDSEGKFMPDEGMKYGDSRRLRLTIDVDAGVRRLQFRYYFELFGTVSLPD